MSSEYFGPNHSNFLFSFYFFERDQKEEVFPRSFISNKTYPSSHSDNNLFRQPVLPSRTGISHYEPYRLNLNVSEPVHARGITISLIILFIIT